MAMTGIATANGASELCGIPAQGWHVVLAHPREEQIAAAGLIGHGLKVYLPQMPRRRLAGRKMRLRLEPMFPTYLFLRSRPQLPWARVRGTPGVRLGVGGQCALMNGEEPGLVPEWALEHVFAKESRLCERPDERPDAPAVGREIEIIAGPFAWFKAVIENIDRLDSQGRIKAGLDIFGRFTTLELEVSQFRVV